MSIERYQRIKAIYFEASTLEGDEQKALLDRCCGDDESMRREVEQLLSVESPATSALPIAIDQDAQVAFERALATNGASGLTFGDDRYRIVRKLGHGGMGEVFLAQQEKPFRRQIALKVIRPGLDSQEVIARFETERQTLARMDYPAIARVYDAGSTGDGRPYFVMEYVDGEPITEYCDRRQWTIRQRLVLMVQVCRGIAHAHLKAIIHRDIKPSNVLVTMQGELAMPKIIDFGISKATSDSGSDVTQLTHHQQLIGTPQYMSPEQAEGRPDIDTRTDVYSLGVLMYELLTGSTPFSSKELRSAVPGEIQRVIREIDPPKPSTRVEQDTHSIGEISASRCMERGRLRGALQGELDWIVMKAIEKDRGRRYETAESFAADVERYLNHEPVVAAPPSRMYQLRKFVRRNRVMVTASGAVAASLLIGIVAFGWQAQVASAQRDRAVRAQKAEAEQRLIAEGERKRAVQAETEIRKQAEDLETVASFQASMLEQLDPATAGIALSSDVMTRFEAALAKSVASEEERQQLLTSFAGEWNRINTTDVALEFLDSSLLRPAVDAIRLQFQDQPLVEARLQQVLADRYANLGLYVAARDLYEKSLATRQRVLGDEHLDTLTSLHTLGTLLMMQGHLDEALLVAEEGLEKSIRLLGEQHLHSLDSMALMGAVLGMKGDWEAAEPYLRTVLDGRLQALGNMDPKTLTAINEVGFMLQNQGRLAEAESYYLELLAGRRQILGESSAPTALAISNLGSLYAAQAKLDQAEKCFRDALTISRRTLGEVHPTTLQQIQNLSAVLGQSGKLDEAVKLSGETLAMLRNSLGSDHPQTLIELSNLAGNLIHQGKFDEAEPNCREAMERRLRLFGPDHPSTLISQNIMGYLLRRQNRPAEAEPFLRAALETGRRIHPPNHPDRLVYIVNMGTLSRDLGRPDDAKTYFREAIENGRTDLGPGHPTIFNAAMNLSALLESEDSHAEQVTLLTEFEPTARQVYQGARAPALATVLVRLGKAHSGLSQFAIAEEKLLEARDILDDTPNLPPAESQKCKQALDDLYAAWHAVDPENGRTLSERENP